MRIKESILMMGSPFLGVHFTIPSLDWQYAGDVIVLLAVVFFLAAHLGSLNDLFDFAKDKENVARKDRPLIAGQISERGLKCITATLAAMGFFLCLFLPLRTFCFALFSVLNLWIYQYPKIALKNIPVLSSFNQFLAGILHFLYGYSLFSTIDLSGILFSFFFGLIFMAGHMNQELIDYDADVRSANLTNAVKFGQKRMFLWSFVFFSLSSLYCFILGLLHVIRIELGMAALISFPVLISLFVLTLKKGRRYQDLNRYRRHYRVLYVLLGITMAFFLIRDLV